MRELSHGKSAMQELRIAVGARWNPGLISSLGIGLDFRVAASETDSISKCGWPLGACLVTLMVQEDTVLPPV